ncbi:Endothelial cell-specific molecule 1 [Branchiostoma belcheri]|nr:Endothelial cell-specific molecule 1 [Branchiostoma belcheri]
MDNSTAFLVVLACLVPHCALGTLQLSATVPENANAGETVTSIRPDQREDPEQVRCEIVAGDENRRFRVTDCVIQVARPLDYGVHPRYNLTVNVTGSSERHQQLYVDVQVQDVEGYPPVYNDTCEMPIRSGPGKSGDLSVVIKSTGELVAEAAGVLPFSTYLPHRHKTLRPPLSFNIFDHTMKSDCLLQLTWAPGHPADIRTIESLFSENVTCFYCHGPLDDASIIEVTIFNGWRNTRCSTVDQTYLPTPDINRHYVVVFLLPVTSRKVRRFTCELPEKLSVIGNRDATRFELSLLEVEVLPDGCPPNRYGMFCDQNCTCENGARCHGLNGACKCQPGWQGVVCDIPHRTVAIIATPGDSRRIYITGSVTLHCRVFHLAAERMTWIFPNETEKWLQGVNEDRVQIHNIQSEHNGTYICTVLTEDGTVINASYELQAVACPPGKTGESCREECACSHGGSCDRWAGCVCPPGWTGTACQTSCPVETYGQGCSSRCSCQHDATCAPTDGRCNCTAGWFGRHCSRPCLAGRYGWKCWQACACKNNATCHHVDGTCACAPPWTGKWCDVIETDTDTFPLSLQIAVPVTLTLLVAALVMLTLYKRNRARHAAQEERLEETRALLELKSMEDDLAQSLQPGWLHRWERSADDLTLDDLVGLGAFAEIRKGQLRVAGADVTVAVKSVREKDRRCYRAFCREVAALIAVHENHHDQHGGHPNIVKLFGVVTKTSPKCIILEFAAKGELLVILKQQPRPNGSLVMFLSYAVQISRALSELRNLRIAHGDVAARNVLVGGDDVAKLADFGLAHDVYTTTTYVSTVQGDADELLPLKWMALESLESREFTCESDTWSFGVLLWEIAAFGEEPSYQRHLSCPKLVGILRQGVRLERPPGCPEKLYNVMKSCWREDPSVRPEPAELERELTECRHEMDPRLFRDLE